MREVPLIMGHGKANRDADARLAVAVDGSEQLLGEATGKPMRWGLMC